MVTIISDLAFLEARHRARRVRGARHWSKAEDLQLTQLYALGIDPALIGMEMKISTRSVERRLYLLGLRSNVGRYTAIRR